MIDGPLYGLLLAGGQGRRLGGRDKAMISLGDRTLVSWALDQFPTHCQTILVAAPVAPEWVAEDRRLLHVPDKLGAGGEPLGPVGGITAALDLLWARHGETAWLATLPVDTPFAPSTVIGDLCQPAADMPVRLARCGDRVQSAFGVWSARCAAQALQLIESEGGVSIQRLAGTCGAGLIDIASQPGDFLNINTPEDLKAAVSRLRA